MKKHWHALGSVAADDGEEIVRIKDILAKPLTSRQKTMLTRLANKPDSEIDFSDIPQLTNEQLAEMVPARLRPKTTLVSFRDQK